MASIREAIKNIYHDENSTTKHAVFITFSIFLGIEITNKNPFGIILGALGFIYLYGFTLHMMQNECKNQAPILPPLNIENFIFPYLFLPVAIIYGVISIYGAYILLCLPIFNYFFCVIAELFFSIGLLLFCQNFKITEALNLKRAWDIMGEYFLDFLFLKIKFIILCILTSAPIVLLFHNIFEGQLILIRNTIWVYFIGVFLMLVYHNYLAQLYYDISYEEPEDEVIKSLKY